MTANNDDKIVIKWSVAAKDVANTTMFDACEEIRVEVLDSAVSCDVTWQKRRYSSLNGAVTMIYHCQMAKY